MKKTPVYRLHITSGRGPGECARAVFLFLEKVTGFLQKQGIPFEVVELRRGDQSDTVESAEVLLKNCAESKLDLFVREFFGESSGALFACGVNEVNDAKDKTGNDKIRGTFCWVSPSPFRPGHKRKNWFFSYNWRREDGHEGGHEDGNGENFKNSFDQRQQLRRLEKEVRMETFRSGGAGGQHVNKTDSAVRLVHLLTGIVVTAGEERSQWQNRRLALTRLQKALEEGKLQKTRQTARDHWRDHDSLTRGGATKTFYGPEFVE